MRDWSARCSPKEDRPIIRPCSIGRLVSSKVVSSRVGLCVCVCVVRGQVQPCVWWSSGKGAGLDWVLLRWLVMGGRWSEVGDEWISQVVTIKAERPITCSSNPGTL